MQLASAKAGFAPAGGAAGKRPLHLREAGEIDLDGVLQRLRAPFSGMPGAAYWSSLHSERAEAAAVLEALRDRCERAEGEVASLSARLADVENELAQASEALASAERRGFELAVSQVYEALRGNPTASAASLILAVGEQPPSPALPHVGSEDVSRELDQELRSLRSNGARGDEDA